MTQERDTTTTQQEQPSQIFHPRFAAFYERYTRLGSERLLVLVFFLAATGLFEGLTGLSNQPEQKH